MKSYTTKQSCKTRNMDNVDVSRSMWNLIVLGFNDTSTLVGHFVSSPREREKREKTAEEMKERNGEGRGTGMKVKKQKK